jgi:hypothetical protein
MDPADVYAGLFRVLTSTRCIPHFDDDGHLVAVDPLTHEEATVLARTLTVHVLDHYQPRSHP